MEPQSTNLQFHASPAVTLALLRSSAPPQEEKGAIGIAFLVWLFGGGLGLAILIFILLKVF